ncbi:MAG: sensor histidine kinase [Calditrichaeota bacterium]|nr:MAG: sensor histidine kinase [Calditrichota bacterium]
MNVSLYRLRGHFKGLLFILALVIIIMFLFYTQKLVGVLRSQSRQILEFYTQLYAQAASTEANAGLNFIFEQIIQRTHFPIIQTDVEGNPTAWKGIGIDPEDHSPETLKKVKKMIQVMKKEAGPIPIKYQEYLLGYLYYGDSKLIKQLQMLPYIEIAVVSLFILVGFLGFRSIQRSEEQFIWVGMSKETAHQIGTPLSSLMGWIEILKSKKLDPDARKTVLEMEKDLERLNQVTARFSQIGSRADLKKVRLSSVIDDVVEYFKRRLPQWGKKVEIVLNGQGDPQVPLNRDLFEWVLENLIKNSLDAIEKDTGTIQIHFGELRNGKKHRIFIDVTDNGRGIESSRKRDIFKPGYSTKKRGWGLGLSLAKRIVEDYHGGKLILKETRTGHGTTMRILL